LENSNLTLTKVVPHLAVGSYDDNRTRYATTVEIVNPSASAVTVSAEFFKEDGSPSGLTMRTNNSAMPAFTGSLPAITVPAYGVLVITADTATTGTSLWGRFLSSGAVTISTVFELRLVFTNILLARVGVSATDGDMRRFVIPRTRNVASGLDTGFALVNVGQTPASLTATLRAADGTTIDTEVRSFSPGQHVADFASGFFNLGSEPSGTNHDFIIFESASPQFAAVALSLEGITLTSLPVERIQ
jgi:hypothetical protein